MKTIGSVKAFLDSLRDNPKIPLLIVSLSAVIALCANIYGTLAGITIVIPHLLYIPIVLCAFFYPKRGVIFAAVLAIIYVLMTVALRPGYPADLISAGSRCIVFILIAVVVSYLSGRLIERERLVRSAKEEWERTFDAVPDLIALIDRNHRFIRINQAMAKALGTAPEEVVGKHCYELVHGTQVPPPGCPHAMLILDSAGHTSEVEEDRLGGDFLVTTSPLYDADGVLIGSVHVARDITERRRAQQAILAANKKLNILSSVTRHDILNKITALYAYLDLSRELCTSPSQCGHIDKEIETIQALQRQVEFTKYYQDIGVHAPEWQDIEAVFARAVSQIRLEGITIGTECKNYQIFADPLIEKVFYNMVENSIRHGEHVTSIQLTARKTGTGLTLVYRDNGVGVPAEIKGKLFQRGFGKHTGLGLFLSREILAITGILITENGEPGKGARFEITVPEGAYRVRKE